MKKKIIALVIMAALACSMAGCKKAEENKTNIVDGTSVSATAAPAANGETAAAESKTEEQIKEELENFAKDADKNADTSKIDGTDLKEDKNSDGEDKADLEGYEVEIKKAVKAEDADGSPVVVVEFKFKNKTSQVAKFASIITADASQGDRILPPALTYEAEGFEPMTIAQDVDTNDSITVQKVYKLVSGEEPVTVTVSRSDHAANGATVTKTFEVK